MSTRERDYWQARSDLGIAPESLTEVMSTAADLALVVTADHRVRSATANPLNGIMEAVADWPGQPLVSLLDPACRSGVIARLDRFRAGEDGPAGPIELNHSEATGWTFPVTYTLHRTSEPGVVLMLGRDLRPVAEMQAQLVRAQLQLERDHDAQRVVETRYRALLESLPDPVILVDGGSGRIIECNRAAQRRLGAAGGGFVTGSVTQIFDGAREDILEALRDGAATVPEDGEVEAITLPTKLIGPARLAVTGFRVMGDRLLVCRFLPAEEAPAGMNPEAAAGQGLFEGSPDPIALVGPDGRIELANDAFAALLDLATSKQARGLALSDLLVRGGLDVRILTGGDCPRDYGVRLRTELRNQVPARVTATDLGARGTILVLRTGPSSAAAGQLAGDAEIVEQVTASASELVGTMPLRDIVASLVDVIEKRCVETAVRLTGNNRVAAAEMLGLSRQSLYVKLRKYRLLTRQDR